jgi:hypothetical protein
MNVHGPSLALGFSAALVAGFAARRLRPIAVELGALAVEMAKAVRATIELQREAFEDFVCDVQVRSAEQTRTRREERMKRDESINSRQAGSHETA